MMTKSNHLALIKQYGHSHMTKAFLKAQKANVCDHSHSASGQSVCPFSQCKRPICMPILTVQKANLYAHSHSAQVPSCMTILTVHKANQSEWPFSQCSRPFSLFDQSHSAQGHSVCMAILTVHKAIQSVWPFSQCTRP